MKGIRFVVDDAGKRTAVLIDLDQHSELWQDFYDIWLADQRKAETRESLDEVRGMLAEEYEPAER